LESFRLAERGRIQGYYVTDKSQAGDNFDRIGFRLRPQHRRRGTKRLGEGVSGKHMGR